MVLLNLTSLVDGITVLHDTFVGMNNKNSQEVAVVMSTG